MNRAGKCSVITGAASGFGRGVTLALAAEGSYIVLADKNADGMLETTKMIVDAGGSKDKLLAIEMDVSLEDDCKMLIEKTITKFNRIDLLVNCAGITLVSNLVDASTTDFDKLVAVNLKSVFMLSKEAMKHLERTKGNVINFSSITSKKNFSTYGIYGALKAALDHMTKTFAIESAEKGIRVNSVNPGACETNILINTPISLEDKKKLFESLKKSTPLKRNATVDDIVRAVMFLSSDDASFITAQNLFVDGGCGDAAMSPL